MREAWETLGAKKTVREAWETVKSMRVGADRVKEISVQKLLREFENIQPRRHSEITQWEH
jgi:hypothetical protein